MAIDLNTLSLDQLATLYNLIAEKQIKKFRDKTTGVERLTAALAEQNSEVFEAEGEYDIRPLQTSTDVEVEKSKTLGRKSPLLGKKLELVRTANPKREKSRTHVRYELYRTVTTSDEFVKKCEELGLGSRREILSDLAYDSKQHFIKLS